MTSSSSDRRIIIITQDGPEQRYVANILCDACEVAAIFVDVAGRPSLIDRVRRLSVREAFAKSLRQAYLWVIRDRRQRRCALQRVLGERSRQFEREELVEKVNGLKSDDLLNRVRTLSPDVIAVYGCGIVPCAVLEHARLAALNMHTGLSPWYRGTHCAFWPIADGKPEMLGATVHECTADVDHGRIFIRVHPQLEPDDGVHDVFARCVRAGARAYSTAVQLACSGVRGQLPEAGGRLCRAVDRGIVSEWRARRRIRNGLIRQHAQTGSECPCDEAADAIDATAAHGVNA